MAVLTSESVLADLRRLPLLTPEQLARVESAAVRSLPGPEMIVKRLTDKGWITPFQAEVLLSGKGSGLVFGHYVLLSRLGEGGMGAVFKARHTRLDRIDALKVIRADRIASKLVAKRFLREIQLTADLNHPHIIKALDAGQVGSQLYLVTEYIAGEDLTTTVRREGTLSVADACLVVYQSALALRHIHERGLIHRDLKPSNIMREQKSRAVKLLDLGLSNSLHERPSEDSQAGNLTKDGVMLGTPDFMPPEQARNPHGVDIRADLYSLGCTFFYLLTGRTVYEGSPVEKLLKHSTAPIPPLILPHGPTPVPLAAIVSKLLAKRPEDRYQTPQELIDALLALRPGQAPTDVPSEAPSSVGAVAEWQSEFDILIASDSSASGVQPAPKKAPRPPARFGWGLKWSIAASVLLSIGLAIGLASRRERGAEPIVADTSTPAAGEEPADEWKSLRAAEKNPAENREQLRTRVLAFRAKNSSNSLGIASAAMLRKLPSPLDRLAPTRDSKADVPIVRVGGARGQIVSLTFSQDDNRLVVVRVGEPPDEWTLPDIQATQRFASMQVGVNESASFAADGRTAASIVDGHLAVWTETGTRIVDVSAERVAIVPDGRSAVVVPADSEGRLLRVDLESGRTLVQLDHPAEGVTGVVVSPDGTACLAMGGENLIRTLSLESGKLLQVFDRPSNLDLDPFGTFGPDGQRLYLTGSHRTAGRFAVGNSSPSAEYEVAPERPNPFLPRFRNQGRPTCIAVSADEQMTAVGTRSGRVHLYLAINGKATQEVRFTRSVVALAFSTHGRVLAVALEDGTIALVPVKS